MPRAASCHCFSHQPRLSFGYAIHRLILTASLSACSTRPALLSLLRLLSNSLMLGVIYEGSRFLIVTLHLGTIQFIYHFISLTLWTPDVFSQTSPWRQTFFRKLPPGARRFFANFPLAPDVFSSPKKVATPRELSYL